MCDDTQIMCKFNYGSLIFMNVSFVKWPWFIYCILYFFFLGGGQGTKVRKGVINVSNQEKIIQYLILTIKQKNNGNSN